MFGGREVGVEAEDAEEGGAGVVELVGAAVDAGEVHADFAFGRGAIESGLPEFEGFVEVPLIGFDRAEVVGGFEGIRIEGESFMVEGGGFGKIAAALDGVGEREKKRGIVGRFAESATEELLGLRLGQGHAAGNDGLPGEGKVAHVFRGIGSGGERNERGKRGR